MQNAREEYDRPIIFGRAEPDDEYLPRPEPLDPYLIDEDREEIEEEEQDEEE
jgi:hypothetical protein